MASDSSTQVYFSILPSESGARNEPAATTRLTFRRYILSRISWVYQCNPERAKGELRQVLPLTFLLFQGFPPSAKVQLLELNILFA